jgi:hypothetical protein
MKLTTLILAAFAGCVIIPRSSAQTEPTLGINCYAGLSITGNVGTVYSVEYVTGLAQTNTSTAWRCLEFLQLPASPYPWLDKSVPVNGKRFYRVVAVQSPTNMGFIPPGTFRMCKCQSSLLTLPGLAARGWPRKGSNRRLAPAMSAYIPIYGLTPFK